MLKRITKRRICRGGSTQPAMRCSVAKKPRLLAESWDEPTKCSIRYKEEIRLRSEMRTFNQLELQREDLYLFYKLISLL